MLSQAIELHSSCCRAHDASRSAHLLRVSQYPSQRLHRADGKCKRSLKTDRLIKIFISDDPEPVHVSEKTLVNASEWFAAAIRHEQWGSEPGVLRFPEDDLDAWKSLLFWLFKKSVPEWASDGTGNDCEAFHLIQCRCLGEKYLLSEFQDAVMHELLGFLANGHQTLQLEAIKEAFENTAAGSLLRKLSAEEVVWQLKVTREISSKEMDHFDGVPGFASALTEALERWTREGRGMFSISTRRVAFEGR